MVTMIVKHCSVKRVLQIKEIKPFKMQLIKKKRNHTIHN